MGGIGGSISALWDSILGFLSQLIIPDWGGLIGMLPLLIFLLVGGFLTLVFLLWAWHAIRSPHRRPRALEGPHAAELDADGRPIFPRGLPYCRTDAAVYTPGTTRCDNGHDLTVSCPMCGVSREASIQTCGNCGLVLQIQHRERFARPAGPPPGGAAVA